MERPLFTQKSVCIQKIKISSTGDGHGGERKRRRQKVGPKGTRWGAECGEVLGVHEILWQESLSVSEASL